MRLNSNGRTMKVYHRVTMNGCHNIVWFGGKSITNIIALRNLRLQFPTTYSSEEIMFIILIESEVKPNIQFRMHESGLHYFNPSCQEFNFFNTVYENK